MIKYGLISETDASCLEKTIDLICDEYNDDLLRVTEIGVYSGETGKGICEYIENVKDKDVCIIGIESIKDDQIIMNADEYNDLIIGNSTEVYNQLEDNSQHLIFVDGDHSLIGVISDFYAYADKVKVGGYIAFHDTGRHIKPFKDFQHGDKDNPDAYISVRKALQKIGLLYPDNFSDRKHLHHAMYDWELVFDEADENNEAGGICIFRKIL